MLPIALFWIFVVATLIVFWSGYCAETPWWHPVTVCRSMFSLLFLPGNDMNNPGDLLSPAHSQFPKQEF